MMKIIGHRGAKALAPENTVAGIRKCLEHKGDGVEFDLRVTKDNIPVLHHNRSLRTSSGEKLAIETHTYSELKQHKPDLATLEEALGAIGPSSLALIEIKPNVPVSPIVKTLKKYLVKGRRTADNLLLLSFSPETLSEVKKALPEVKVMVNEKWSSIRVRYRARDLQTKYINMNARWLWWGLIGAMARRGWKVYAYGQNNPKKASIWAKQGLAGVITDYPDKYERSVKG